MRSAADRIPLPDERSNQLVLILGDQLSPSVAALRAADVDRDVVLMAEVHEEATYVRHHKKKIGFVFAAMRSFAAELSAAGWHVDYVRLESPGNSGSILGEVERAVAEHNCNRVLVTKPGEWRLLDTIKRHGDEQRIEIELLEDDRFLCSEREFAQWASGRKQLRMENFYREMRRKTGLLMEKDGKPCGGRWNFDVENRRPPRKGLTVPTPKRVPNDTTTREVLDLVADRFEDHFGTLEPFWFAVTRVEAEAAFDHFLETALAQFGDYQDAMLRDEPFMFHAVIALYLNAGLLDPLAVCRRVEEAYRAGGVSLNAAEGFIRQIIGWREYVRGIYWLQMPGYVDENFFAHHNPLPDFYWTADTDMACMRACIGQTRDEAYAHHIQRLMVTGNFAMLAGIDPHEVHEWYLAVYADAYEWVEAPNTLGMSQFADGGLLASKPYAASGNYINRMSNYCADCQYDVKTKVGQGACPFNFLYWDFLDRNRDRLRTNTRLAYPYRNLDRMDAAQLSDIRRDAAAFMERLRS
ncbi:MAG: cryptochrome/photolyase family protein [Pseudomonadota bacterium]